MTKYKLSNILDIRINIKEEILKYDKIYFMIKSKIANDILHSEILKYIYLYIYVCLNIIRW